MQCLRSYNTDALKLLTHLLRLFPLVPEEMAAEHPVIQRQSKFPSNSKLHNPFDYDLTAALLSFKELDFECEVVQGWIYNIVRHQTKLKLCEKTVHCDAPTTVVPKLSCLKVFRNVQGYKLLRPDEILVKDALYRLLIDECKMVTNSMNISTCSLLQSLRYISVEQNNKISKTGLDLFEAVLDLIDLTLTRPDKYVNSKTVEYSFLGLQSFKLHQNWFESAAAADSKSLTRLLGLYDRLLDHYIRLAQSSFVGVAGVLNVSTPYIKLFRENLATAIKINSGVANASASVQLMQISKKVNVLAKADSNS